MHKDSAIAFAVALALGAPCFGDIVYNPNVTAAPSPNWNIVWAGNTTTQGDAAMNAPQARTNYGVTGSNIKIGIISDSFAASSAGYAAGVASGDLPATTIVKDSTGTDEGRAMAEIVHDVAPGAQIMFHSAFNNAGSSVNKGQSIATAINNLVAAGANVIVDDVGFLNQPVYQLDAAAMAVKNAKANGVAYFSAAGNSGNEAVEGNFNGAIGQSYHAFNNNQANPDNVLAVRIPAGRTSTFTLHWAEPYATQGTTPNSKLELLWYNGASVFSVANDPNGDPVELLSLTNSGSTDATIGLVVEGVSGNVANEKFRIMAFNGFINDAADDTNSSTIFGHKLTEDGVMVGAHFYGDPSNPESFSARGPGQLLFDYAGNPINEIVDVPSLIAPDGGNTTFFGQDIGADADSFPNFFGTSAAAPHAAAVAALMLERAAQMGIRLTVEDIYQLMFMTAVDVGAPGFDSATGYGRLDAFAAVAAVPEPTILMIAVLPAILLRRRRRAAA